MKGLDKVQINGMFVGDLEIPYTPEGKQMARFSMAVNRTFNNLKGKALRKLML